MNGLLLNSGSLRELTEKFLQRTGLLNGWRMFKSLPGIKTLWQWLSYFANRGDRQSDIIFPLRKKDDFVTFATLLIILPSIATVALSCIITSVIFPDTPESVFSWVNFIHLAFLLFFLTLLWLPSILAFKNWKDWIETVLVYGRNVVLVFVVLWLFPHRIVHSYLQITPYYLYYIGLGVVVVLYLLLTFKKIHSEAAKDIRAARAPGARPHSERLLWFDATTFCIVLFSTIIIEFAAVALAGSRLEFTSITYNGIWDTLHQFANWMQDTYEKSYQYLDQHDKSILAADNVELNADQKPKVLNVLILAWICGVGLAGLLLFMAACLGNRLLTSILLPVTFHERDMRGVVYSAPKYLWHFSLAMLFKHSVLLIAGVGITLLFLCIPVALTAAKQYADLISIVQVDLVILAFGVMVAWFGPLALAVVHPDETFGDYFNQRLANHLMMVQGHMVLFGFGSLGQRVLDNEVNLKYAQVHKHEDLFLEVVTPDVTLETMYTKSVVIERSENDVVYSSENNLLGDYGVIGTSNRIYKSLDPNGRLIHPATRILVPVVIGEAKEPFIGSRVNLERARLIISTVPEGEAVQTIFNRAAKGNIRSIIAVSRSDQISYLTYRARHRPIVLVYPKNNQGTTLGHRLNAAIQKVQAAENMPKDDYPAVLVMGNSKSNHYMIETMWTYLKGTHQERKKTIRNMFAFVFISADEMSEYPELRPISDEEKSDAEYGPFDLELNKTFITGARYPYSSVEQETKEDINLPARTINEQDIMAIQACLDHHNPRILVINHSEVEKSSLMLLRCMRAVERLNQKKSFDMPLILISAARGDEMEWLVLGDSSRYYDAILRLYGGSLANDPSYPAHARYDHYSRRPLGESISDSLADAQEIISGALRSYKIRDDWGLFQKLNRYRLGRSSYSKFLRYQLTPAALDSEIAPHIKKGLLEYLVYHYAGKGYRGEEQFLRYLSTDKIRELAESKRLELLQEYEDEVVKAAKVTESGSAYRLSHKSKKATSAATIPTELIDHLIYHYGGQTFNNKDEFLKFLREYHRITIERKKYLGLLERYQYHILDASKDSGDILSFLDEPKLRNEVFRAKKALKERVKSILKDTHKTPRKNPHSIVDWWLQHKVLRNVAVKWLQRKVLRSAEASKRRKLTITEMSSCLPNTPMALPAYVSRLAGLKFVQPTGENHNSSRSEGLKQLETAWTNHTNSNIGYVPSFNYLRHVKLGDPDHSGFVLTGYAALIPLTDSIKTYDKSDYAGRTVRIFANDGQNYAEQKPDPYEAFENKNYSEIHKRFEYIYEPWGPGITEVIDRMSDRPSPGSPNTVAEFREVMLDDGDPPNGETNGACICPGMNQCRIAAFQDYVAASNHQRLENAKKQSEYQEENNLWHARNYYCSTSAYKYDEIAIPQPEHLSARIFCCANGTNEPGMLARVLNSLYFKLNHERAELQKDEKEDWRVGIHYFNHTTCQNSHFTLNRLFGILKDHHELENEKPWHERSKKWLRSKMPWNKSSEPDTSKLTLPLQLIRILPIGGKKSGQLWYHYAMLLYKFLKENLPKHVDDVERVNFYWLDPDRNKSYIKDFNDDSNPIALVIKITHKNSESPKEKKKAEMCDICGRQEKRYNCSKYRAWV